MKTATWIALSICLGIFTAAAFGQEPPLPNPDVMSKEYWALWNDKVQKNIDDRIEKYRKNDAVVFLGDVKPDTEVVIEQISHEFLFGANIFNFGQLGTKQLDDKYKAVFGDLFNTAAIAFYWKKLEPEEDNIRYETSAEDNPEFWGKIYAEGRNPFDGKFWRRPAPDQVVEFCEQKGIYRHGHPIIWGNTRWHHPEWLPATVENLPKIEKTFEQRIRRLAERYGDRINRWDIVNESALDKLNPHHSKYDPNDPKGLYNILPRDYTFKAFKTANEVFPKGVVQSINDYDMGFGYVNQVSDLQLRGCRIDMVGLQMHLFNPKQCADIAKGAKIQHPEHLLTLMDRFNELGKPLHLSEITVTAPNDDVEGREIQANIARNLYRMWFSWPNMRAITWWNVVDGCGAPGEPTTSGLCTRTMEKKPSYHALDRLINYEWKTRIVKKADESRFTHHFRGFRGKYKISWTDVNGKARTAELNVQ